MESLSKLSVPASDTRYVDLTAESLQVGFELLALATTISIGEDKEKIKK